jgi:hypothetical protein
MTSRRSQHACAWLSAHVALFRTSRHYPAQRALIDVRLRIQARCEPCRMRSVRVDIRGPSIQRSCGNAISWAEKSSAISWLESRSCRLSCLGRLRTTTREGELPTSRIVIQRRNGIEQTRKSKRRRIPRCYGDGRFNLGRNRVRRGERRLRNSGVLGGPCRPSDRHSARVHSGMAVSVCPRAVGLTQEIADHCQRNLASVLL